MECLGVKERAPGKEATVEDCIGFIAHKGDLPIAGLAYIKIVDDVANMFKAFGDAISTIFTDPLHGKEAREIGHNAAESIEAAGNRLMAEYCMKSLCYKLEEDRTAERLTMP